jgi:hypothetical protein
MKHHLSTDRPDEGAAMPLTDLVAQVRVVHWLGLSVGILAADYATGPFIQIAILFVIPVA